MDAITKEDLRKFRRERLVCNDLRDRRAEIRDTIDGLKAANLSGLPGGSAFPTDEKIVNAIENLKRLDAIYLMKLAVLSGRQAEIEALMSAAKLTGEEQLVIRLYYFDALAQWENVAAKMNYSRSRVFEIHGEAIFKLNFKRAD